LDYDDIEFNWFRFDGGEIWLRGKGDNVGVGKEIVFKELYAANSPVINLNMELKGDDVENGGSAVSDKIKIGEVYDAGVGKVIIRGKGVIGSNDVLTVNKGIKVVDFGDSAMINGGSIFELAGGKIDNGAYEYEMYQYINGNDIGNNKDYYIRNAIGESGEAILTDLYKTMANVPLLNVLLARAGMDSMERHIWEMRGIEDSGDVGLWVKGYVGREEAMDMVKTEINYMGIDGGFDVLVNPGAESNKIYLGIMFGYMGAMDVRTGYGNGDRYGDGGGKGVSFGIYGSWVGNGGWFCDIASRYFLTEFDMASYSVGGYRMGYRLDRDVWGNSIGVGNSIKIKVGEYSRIRIEPMVGMEYIAAMEDSAVVENGVGDLEYGQGGYLRGRAGVLFGYGVIGGGGVKAEPYLEVGYREEFMGKQSMRYGGVGYESDICGGGFEGAVGVDIGLGGLVSMYMRGKYEEGEKIRGYGGDIGIRVGIMRTGAGKVKAAGEAGVRDRNSRVSKDNKGSVAEGGGVKVVDRSVIEGMKGEDRVSGGETEVSVLGGGSSVGSESMTWEDLRKSLYQVESE
jgi:outer membrane autotransporter protein